MYEFVLTMFCLHVVTFVAVLVCIGCGMYPIKSTKTHFDAAWSLVTTSSFAVWAAFLLWG